MWILKTLWRFSVWKVIDIGLYLLKLLENVMSPRFLRHSVDTIGCTETNEPSDDWTSSTDYYIMLNSVSHGTKIKQIYLMNLTNV